MSGSRPLVRVWMAGATLSAACGREVPPAGPPGSPVEVPMMNPPPPPPLPAWEEVLSNHPEGATNPPVPYLEVLADGSRCFKAWRGGMVPPDRAILLAGGKVVGSVSEATGVEIRCDAEKVAELLRKTAEAAEEPK